MCSQAATTRTHLYARLVSKYLAKYVKAMLYSTV